MKHVTGPEISRSKLPNKDIVQNVVDLGHLLAKTYISERLDKCENWGLSRDSTSRRKQNILDTSVTLDNGDIISLGFNQVARETGITITNVTKNHLRKLGDMHSASSNAEKFEQHKEEFVARSLQKLAFIMSDRASNENKLISF